MAPTDGPGGGSGAPKRYAFRQRYTKHNYSLLGAELPDEEEEEEEAEGVTPAMTAAAAAGLDARAMSHMEERDFERVTRGGAGKIAQYLSVRCEAASSRPAIVVVYTLYFFTHTRNGEADGAGEGNIFGGLNPKGGEVRWSAVVVRS